MGCCKTKIDESTGINYEEEEPRRFYFLGADKHNHGYTDDNIDNFFENKIDDNYRKTKAGLIENSKYTKDYDNDEANTCEIENVKQAGNQKNINKSDSNVRQIDLTNVNYPSLDLLIKESKFNEINTKLKITPAGLVGSTRKANDGYVYFGLQNEEVSNDFFFKQEEGVNKQHFEIKFDKEKFSGYYVKNLNGSGVFIKIESPFTLKEGVIISFGTNHLLVSVNNNDQKDQLSTISFKAITGPNKGDEYVFNSTKNDIIRFGRKKNNTNNIDVAFTEESTSRIQSTITFDASDNSWKIIDSDGDKRSLNGTWYLADDYVHITYGINIRVGTTTFQASFSDYAKNS